MRWIAATGRSATHGARNASATITPCGACAPQGAAADARGSDFHRVGAWVEQDDPSRGGDQRPLPVCQALEMRHEADDAGGSRPGQRVDER